jgi:hypothetical protein
MEWRGNGKSAINPELQGGLGKKKRKKENT